MIHGTENSAHRASATTSKSERLVSRVLLFLLFVGLLFILWVIATAPRLDRLEQTFVETSNFDPLAEAPATEANAAALEIEELASALGLRLAPEEEEDRPTPTPEDSARFDELSPKIADYFVVLMSESSPSLAVDAELEAYLDQQIETLEEIAAVLRGSRASSGAETPAANARAEGPRWELDYAQGINLEAPKLFHHMRLHGLLLMAAARAILADRVAESSMWVEAAAQLRRSLKGQMPMIFVLVQHAELRHEAALLRRLEKWPDGVREEIEGLLSQRTLENEALLTFRLESWLLLQTYRAGDLVEPEQPAYIRWATQLIGRHGVRHHHRAMERMIELKEERGLVDFDPGEASAVGLATIPKWSLVARMVLPDFTRIFIRAARTELDLELTLLARDLEPRLATSSCQDLEETLPSLIDGIDWQLTCEGQNLRIAPSRTFDANTGTPLLPFLIVERSESSVQAMNRR